ncbi:MAG: cytochrome c oxidase subunit [Gaiellaceae bacterium]|jgi:cytochrome c oxidase subunit 2|nr:cytochrome c oxidase subunit [Gaiellaceae bacterium]
MRRGSIVALLGIGLIAGGVATAVALIPTWLPVDASREAGRIDFIFWFVIAICIGLFAVVAAAMTYSIIKFRAAPDDLEDGPSIHGHTGLEIAWTAIPFVLVTAIAIVCGIVLSKNNAEGANPVIINVKAQQYAWSFSYPDANNATSPVLHLPVDTSIVLHMRSLDVIHAFFVPEFRENEDIVPGMVTKIHITPDRIGQYPLECNELCGAGHTLMNTEVIVESQADFQKWIAEQKAQSTTGTSG